MVGAWKACDAGESSGSRRDDGVGEVGERGGDLAAGRSAGGAPGPNGGDPPSSRANYSVPAALEAWLDQVTFPRMSLAPPAGAPIEIAWSQSIKPTQNFTRLLPTLLCFGLAAVAVYLLSRAMRTLPVGTVYAVFTGIGALGLGVIVDKDPLSAGRVWGLSMIVCGIILPRIADPH